MKKMRKIFYVLLTLICSVFLLVSCGKNDTPTPSPASTSEEPKKAIDSLLEKEKTLMDIIIKMASAKFSSPSSIKVVAVKKPSELPIFNDIVIVQLQGENKYGATVSEYYAFIVKVKSSDLMTDSERKEKKSMYNKLGQYIKAMGYYGEVGDYLKLSDDSQIGGDASGYDVGNINRAISEYWEEKGF